ncbi:MAG: hypothetical protein JO342_02820 [Solirubrobacterales bacterium]|nr:hypothetical protein [Solirubrobacterales bacterium]
MRRQTRRVVVFLTVVLLTWAPAASAHAATNERATSHATWVGLDLAGEGPVVITDFAGAVQRAVAADPALKPALGGALARWLGRLEASGGPGVPGTATLFAGMAELVRAQAALHQTGTASDPVATIATRNPQDFPVFGEPANSNRTWEMRSFWISHVELKIENGKVVSEKLTDKVTANAEINPGAVTSKIDFSLTYLPDSGEFSRVHLQVWVLCYRNRRICNTENSADLGSTKHLSPLYISSSEKLYGDKISHAIKLWGKIRGSKNYDSEGVLSGFATCNKTNPRCRYS